MANGKNADRISAQVMPPETFAIRQRFRSIYPNGIPVVLTHIINTLKSRSPNDKFWRVLLEGLWEVTGDDPQVGVPRGRNLSNEALIQKAEGLNPLNGMRLLGYLTGAYADRDADHHFWKAAAAALASYKPGKDA